jgi:hypothetical protein
MHISERISQDDKQIIGYSTQTSLYLRQLSNSLSSTVNQWGWDTYYLWEYKIIGKIKWCQRSIKFNHPRLISTISNPQRVITTDASPITWGATFQVVEQNIKINEKREMKKPIYIAPQV